jgi:ferric-dicitrate binding protein FerR (iron transport regulator)
MKNTDRELNTIIDDVTAEIREERLDPAVVEGAAQRVWTRLTGEQAAVNLGVTPVEQLRSCEDFQALIPGYLHGVISSARIMLLEDHTRECVPCRKALKEARSGNQAPRQLELQKARAAASSHRMNVLRWGIAAVLVVGIGMIGWPWAQRLMNTVGTLQAIVEAANGNVYKVSDSKTQTVKTGEKLQRGEHIRTAKSAGAVVKLSDGSLIEMRERSEFSVNDNATGITINLERGNIIVQAAKQRDRKLFVATEDVLVSVTGTIFSVNNGTKGARVSVIEGEVNVDQGGKEQVLRAGQQVTTHPSIERNLVKDEISWSQNADQYTKMLDAVRSQVDQQVSLPGSRYSTRLLDLMPENTMIYVAIPNLSQTLAEANRILQENIQKNPELREWWDKEQAESRGQFGIQRVIKQMSEFGQYLGQEIAVGAQSDAVLVLAELNNPQGFRSYLEQQIADLNLKDKHALPAQIIEDPLTSNLPPGSRNQDDGPNRLLIWIEGDLLAASTELSVLQSLARTVESNGANRFASSAFHARLADVYREGAGFLISADLEKVVGMSLTKRSQKESGERESAALNQLGVTSLRHFIIEIKEKDGKPYNRAVVSFTENHHGLTSWLAQPSPMGALEFISPDANIVAAFVVKEPTAMVDDLLNTLKTADADAWQKLQDFQTEQGIDLRNDFAAPLGGEYAFAIDGPLLPIPSWKAVFQVDDQEHLQQTFERTVEKLNAQLAKEGKKGFVWSKAESGNRTFYTLKSLDLNVEVNYAYAYGYAIAAPSRALVENAIKYRDSGYTLLQSSKFKASLPEDKQANFSAMIYQNIGSVVAPVAKMVGQTGAPNEARQVLSGLLGKKAGLAYVYAFDDRMIFSVNSEDGPVGVSASDLLGLPGSPGLGHIIRAVGH